MVCLLTITRVHASKFHPPPVIIPPRPVLEPLHHPPPNLFRPPPPPQPNFCPRPIHHPNHPPLPPVHPPYPDPNRLNQLTGHLPKLPFPMFDGVNLKRWRSLCEKYFATYVVDPSLWIGLVEHYMEGLAAIWYQSVSP
jgi:hypothetical protein